MIDSAQQRDPLELLADEFAARCRRGELPSVAEYAAKYPQYADAIEELLPAVAMMEQFRADERARREAVARQSRAAAVPGHLGDFDVIQEIGRGGMGIVYEAEQKSLGRRVALKVLPRHVLLLDKDLKRFQREARTAARLHHTNIVPVFGVGDQDGLHYYVMPLVRGVGLDEVLRELRSPTESSAASAASTASQFDLASVVRSLTARRFGASPASAELPADASADTTASCRSLTRRLRPSQEDHTEAGAPAHRRDRGARRGCDRRAKHWRAVARIGVQAAEALDYAHAQGMLHRDIKPGNLLVDEGGVIYVADFGLARAVDSSEASRSGEVVGTLRYMAPEQLRGEADARSDVYALGLTLYELLTLRPAFEDTDRRRFADGRPAAPEPAPPRKIDPAVPCDLETIVLKCLAAEPSKRYATAAELGADLRRFLDDRPIRARRATLVERAWRWCRRNPALAGVSALAGVLLIAFVGTGLVGLMHTRRAYTEATAALARAEATSQVALDVLEDIYRQLSPDRVWIASDSDPGGEACACIGLRSGDPLDRPGLPVPVSRETAALLENLLVFYDRLAEQAGDDAHVMLQSAIAGRRVGDIRQRLGQLDRAEHEYLKAVDKLAALAAREDSDAAVRAELACCHNEIGNLCSAKQEPDRAYRSHRRALSVLEAFHRDGPSDEAYRYELARTYYFLSNKRPALTDGEDATAPGADAGGAAVDAYRASAVELLEELVRERPAAPDYRFLLALCHRPSGIGPGSEIAAERARGREQAIRILEELKEQFPGVADYRYELTATYAWVHVGLFPWQGPSAPSPKAERSLRKALEESSWLVERNPAIPHYARARALVLAKLGTICARSRRLAEAEGFFRQAFEAQDALVAEFPDLPSHNRVLLEFLRLRLGEVSARRSLAVGDLESLEGARELLEASAGGLAELAGRPELADDRVAASSLPLAYDVLSRVLSELGRDEPAADARRNSLRLRARETWDDARLLQSDAPLLAQ